MTEEWNDAKNILNKIYKEAEGMVKFLLSQYRRNMCRIGLWFLNRAGIFITHWEKDNDQQS